MKHFFNMRIFWACRVTEGGDGYYYHTWSNWFLAEEHAVFAWLFKACTDPSRLFFQDRTGEIKAVIKITFSTYL